MRFLVYRGLAEVEPLAGVLGVEPGNEIGDGFLVVVISELRVASLLLEIGQASTSPVDSDSVDLVEVGRVELCDVSEVSHVVLARGAMFDRSWRGKGGSRVGGVRVLAISELGALCLSSIVEECAENGGEKSWV